MIKKEETILRERQMTDRNSQMKCPSKHRSSRNIVTFILKTNEHLKRDDMLIQKYNLGTTYTPRHYLGVGY